MKTCLHVRVLAIEGDKVTNAECVSLDLISDAEAAAIEYKVPPEVGDVIHVLGEMVEAKAY